MNMNMSLMQMLRIVRLRWWLVLLLFTLSLSGAYVFTLVAPKRFASTVSIIVETKIDPLLAALAPNLGGGYLFTQTQIIKSDRIASRVVKILGFADNPAAVTQWQEETGARVPIETYFGELLQKHLTVDLGNGSSIISLTYVGQDPKFAAAVANAFARAYIELSVELRVGPAREYASFFDERQKSLRSDLEAAQSRLSEFQKKRGLVVTAAQVDVESARLTSIEAALAAAVADSAETSSRQRNAGTEASVDVQQSTAIQGLKGDLARAETKLNEISTTYGPNHPARIQLEAQIAELKDQISKEMRRVSGATSNVNRIAGQKIGELRAMAEAQKRTVLAMRAERDEASVLLRDLETAQKAYEQVAQRRAQLANESQADQATARILSPAQEAVKQSFPNIVVTAVVAVALGLVLGVGAALCWEALDRRIRGEADMHVVDGIPLLGVISARAGRPGEVRRLVPARPGSGPPRLEMERGG